MMNWNSFASTIIVGVVTSADLGVLLACALSGVPAPPATEEALPVLVGALALSAGRDASTRSPNG